MSHSVPERLKNPRKCLLLRLETTKSFPIDLHYNVLGCTHFPETRWRLNYLSNSRPIQADSRKGRKVACRPITFSDTGPGIRPPRFLLENYKPAPKLNVV